MLNLKAAMEHNWSQQEDDYIRRCYKDLSYAQIARDLGINDRSILRRRALKLGLKKFTGKAFNHQIFSEWNPVSAYLLGIMASDGSISYDETHCDINIRTAIKDSEHLKRVAALFESKKEAKYLKSLDSWVLSLSSRKACEDLIRYGIVPNKSNVGFSIEVPDQYLREFLTGFTDGDGTVSFSHGFKWQAMQGQYCKGVLYYLRDKIKNVYGQCPRLKPVKSDGSIWALEFTCSQAESFLNWMYSHSTYRMARKYEVFLKFKHN